MTVHPVLPHLICAEFSLICTVQTLGFPRTGTRLPGEGCRLVCASRQSPSPPCAPRHREVWVRHRNGRHECSLRESADVLGVDEIPDHFVLRTVAASRGKKQENMWGTTPTARVRSQTIQKLLSYLSRTSQRPPVFPSFGHDCYVRNNETTACVQLVRVDERRETGNEKLRN